MAESFRLERYRDFTVPKQDPRECRQVDREGPADGRGGGVEGHLPPAQGARDYRRRQSLGSASGLLEAERSGLCGRGLEQKSTSQARPGTRRPGRASLVETSGQGYCAADLGPTTSASRESEVLSGTAGRQPRNQNAGDTDRG